MRILRTTDAILRTLGIQLEWVIERKEVNNHVLDDLISTASDDDVTARAFSMLREFQHGIRGENCGTQSAFRDELGRGHRRTGQATTPHALESRARMGTEWTAHLINRSLLTHALWTLTVALAGEILWYFENLACRRS